MPEWGKVPCLLQIKQLNQLLQDKVLNHILDQDKVQLHLMKEGQGQVSQCRNRSQCRSQVSQCRIKDKQLEKIWTLC
jgi:hypothetical protein